MMIQFTLHTNEYLFFYFYVLFNCDLLFVDSWLKCSLCWILSRKMSSELLFLCLPLSLFRINRQLGPSKHSFPT